VSGPEQLPPAAPRSDFPILARSDGGRRLVYLDSAATSQKPRAVLEAMESFYRRSNGNPHRAVHRLAEESTLAMEAGRAAVARLLGAPAEEVVFTRGATESINLVAQGWAEPRLRPGDEVVVTGLEHHSNLLPWQRAAKRTGATLRAVPLTDEGALDLTSLEALINPRTKLVAVAQVSNAIGTLVDIPGLAQRAHAVGAVVVVDGAQSVPHLPVDVATLGADFLAFSGHKMLGPTGIGVLWGRAARLAETEPLLLGGGMVREVTLEGATYKEGPGRLEAGTPAVAEAVGLGAACDYLLALGLERLRAHERDLTALALQRLADVPGLTQYGPRSADARGGVVSFNLRGVHPHDLAAFLDERGLCVRAGTHCAQPLLRRLGVMGTARASFSAYSGSDDVEALAVALDEARGLA
jgi:cysteine desulfurase/selenocysteine lyase